MGDALGHAAHDLRLRDLERLGGHREVAGGDRLLDLADEGADARAARAVDSGAALGLARALLGGRRVCQVVSCPVRIIAGNQARSLRARGARVNRRPAGACEAAAAAPHLPRNYGLRFSTKAAMPSALSSVANVK